VLSVWNEVIASMGKGALIIDCSTIDVESAKQAHALAAKHGIASVDAPVSGGTGGAKGATLTFMCGGEDKAFAAAKPVLEKMGKKIVHCGGAGAGQAAKICNNMILGISMIAVSEAFALAEKLGLSHQALFDVASTSSGQCWSLTTYCPVPGPVPRLTRAVGKAKAMELCLTGRMMDVEEAERAGLVSRIVPADELLADAQSTAETIASMSLPITLMAKEAVNRAFESSLAEGIRFERRLFHSAFATHDQKEGMAAFTEKRPPHFLHR
jgi:hypothetical protein